MKSLSVRVSGAVMSVLLILGASASRAATLYWDGNGLASNNWATLAGWDTLADGTGGNPGAAPGINDIAFFNVSSLNSAIVAALSGNVTISGLVFNSTGTTAIRTDVANRRIFLGEGGILVNAGAGAVTFGITTDGYRVPLSLRAQTIGSTQSWVNNSANLFSLNANNTVISTNTLGAWVFGGSGNITMGGVISGSGTNLIKTGAGTLTLSAANTYAGTTGRFTIAEGRVRVGNNAAFSTGVLALNGGALSSDSATARVLANTNIFGGNVTLGHATDSGQLTLSGPGILTGTRTLTVDSAVVYGGVIGDGGGGFGLTKAGAGTLSLLGANTHAGTVIQGGTLGVTNDLALGAIGTALTFDGGALQPGVAMTRIDRAIVLTGAGTLIGSAGFTRSITGAVSGAGTLTFTGGGTNILSGHSPSLSGGFAVNAGRLVVTGASPAGTPTTDPLGTGTVTLNGGALAILDNGDGLGAAQTLTYDNDIVLSTSSTILVDRVSGSGTDKTIRMDQLTMNAPSVLFTNRNAYVVFFGGSGGASVINTNVTFDVASGTVQIGTNNSTTAIGQALTDGAGSFGLTKIGGGTLQLGGTHIDGVLTANAGTLQLNATNNVLPGGIVLNAGTLLVNAQDGVLGAPGSPDVIVNGGTVDIRTGSGMRSVGLDVVSNATLALRNNNSTIFTNESVVIEPTATAFTLNVNRAGGSNTDRTMTLNGPVTTAGPLTFNVTGANGFIAAISGAVASVTLGGDITFNPTTAPLIVSPGISDGGSGYALTKSGTGLLTLNGANSYSGATRILDGTLALGANGSISNSPSISIAAGKLFDVSAVTGGWTQWVNQTVSGPGSIRGDATVLRGRIEPGASPGTLTYSNNLVLVDANVQFELAGVGTVGGGVNDLVDVKGNLTLTGVSTNVIVPWEGALASSYTLFTYGGTLTGGAGNLVGEARGVRPGYTFTFDTSTGTSIVMNVAGSSSPLNLTWAAGSGAWDVATTASWAGGEKFYQLDSVTFDNSGATAGVTNAVVVDTQVAPGGMTVGSDRDYAISGGSIGGTGSLTKAGTGLLILGTSNTFSGATAILDGRVVLANASALKNSAVSNAVANGLGFRGFQSIVLRGLSGAGDIPLTNEAAQGVAMTVGGDGASTTFGGALNDQGLGGSFTKVGAGTLTLTGALNVAQGFTNYAGTVVFGATGTNSVGSDFRVGFGAGSSGTIVQNAGTVIASGGNGLLLGNVTDSGASGTYIMNGGALVATPTAASRGILVGVNNVTTGTFHLVDGIVTGKILQVSRSDGTAPRSVGYYYQSGGTAGFANVTVAGGGAVNSSNNYALLAISNGTFRSTAFGGLASGNDSTGLVHFGQGARVTLPAFPTVRGTNSYSEITFDGGTLSPIASSAAYMQNLTRAYLTANGGTFDVGAGLAITITQAFENAGVDAGTLRKAGIGTLMLAGANTFSGGATVSNGVLSFARPSAMPAGGTVTGLAGAAVGLGVGGAGFYASADVDSLWAGTMAGVTLEAGALVGIDTSAGDFAYGTAQSTRGLAKTGAGTLILTGANTFNGGIVLYEGTLNVSNDTVMGASGSGLTFRGGTLKTSGDMTFDNRGVTLDTFGVFSPDAAKTLTITNPVVGAGALVKTGDGRLVLAGASTYSGGTTSAAGVLALGGNNVLGNGALVLAGGTVAADGVAARVLTNAISITTASGLGDAVNNGVLTLSGPVDLTAGTRSVTNFSAVILSGVSTNGQISKYGPGTLTLQGGVHVWAGGDSSMFDGTVILNGAAVTNAATIFRPSANLPGGQARFVITNGASIVMTELNNNLRAGYQSGDGTQTNIIDIAGTVRIPNASASHGRLMLGSQSALGVANLLAGGDLQVRYVMAGDQAINGQSVLNLDGGVLRPRANEANFIRSITAANVMSGGAFIDTSGFDITILQPLVNGGGGGGLTKFGEGVLTLGGTNTYAGNTLIAAGALSITSTNALPGLFSAGGYAVSNGVVLAVGNVVTETEVAAMLGTGNFLAGSLIGFDTSDGTRTLADSVADTVNGALGLAKVGPGTLVITNANTYTGGTRIYAGGTLQVGNGGTTGALGTGGVINNGVLAFNRSDAAAALGSTVSGPGALVQAGSGTLTINAAQLYTGSTTVRQGVVTLGLTDALPTATALVLGDGATAGTLDLGVSDQTLGTLGVSSTGGAVTNRLVIGAGRTLTVNGNVAVGANVDNSSANLTATGGGTLVVATNGGTFRTSLVTAGTDKSGQTMVDFSGLGAFLMDLGTGAMTVSAVGDNNANDRSTVILSASNALRAATITVGGSNIGAINQLRLGSGTNILYTDSLSLGTFGRDSGQVLFDGATGGLRLRDSSGAGRVNVAIGTNNNGTGYTAANTFDVTGHEADLLIGSLRMGQNASRSGAWSTTFAFDQGVLDVTSVEMAIACKAGTVGNSRLNIGGGIVNLGSVSLSSSTATGTLAITGGTVTLAGNIVKQAGGRGVLLLNGGTLEMQGNAIGSAAAPIDVVGLYSGTLRNVAEINGGAALTKTTGGTLTIEGANAYTGGLTVAAGTLKYNGTYTGGGLITVQGTATLMGTGTVAGVTVASGGTIKPGNSAGALTTAALTLDGGALLEFELGTSSDLILAGATLLGGVDFDNFTFLPGVGFGPGVYTLVNATSISGLGSGTTGTVGSYDATLSIDGDAQDLVLTVVPEPGTLGMLGVLGVAGWLLRRRRAA